MPAIVLNFLWALLVYAVLAIEAAIRIELFAGLYTALASIVVPVFLLAGLATLPFNLIVALLYWIARRRGRAAVALTFVAVASAWFAFRVAFPIVEPEFRTYSAARTAIEGVLWR